MPGMYRWVTNQLSLDCLEAAPTQGWVDTRPEKYVVPNFDAPLASCAQNQVNPVSLFRALRR